MNPNCYYYSSNFITARAMDMIIIIIIIIISAS